jgi:hypothetical protein
MGGECSTNGGMLNAHKILLGRGLSVDVKIILKGTSKK